MGQEFIIKSQKLEDKINQLLPSQGGFQAGVDLSATTQIVPIIDLTESAEGSNQREDLQKSLSLNTITAYNVINTTTTIVNTTGYYRLFGNVILKGSGDAELTLTDGTTTKKMIVYAGNASFQQNIPFDFVVFTEAGHSITVKSTSGSVTIIGNSRQIADISGNLTNP